MDGSLGWLTRDGKLIISARIVRTFGYGFLNIVLAIYLKLVGFGDAAIGLVLTTTLVNSVISALVASFHAAGWASARFLSFMPS